MCVCVLSFHASKTVDPGIELPLHGCPPLSAAGQHQQGAQSDAARAAAAQDGPPEQRAARVYEAGAGEGARRDSLPSRAVHAAETAGGKQCGKCAEREAKYAHHSFVLQEPFGKTISEYIVSAIEILVAKKGPENLKCVCQCLKVGAGACCPF